MASAGRLRGWLPVTVAAAAATVLAGCATVPSEDAPQQVTTGGSQVQAYALPLAPPGPKPRLAPRQVVLGFLHASASYAVDPGAARQFLAPALRKSWHPGPVTVVSSISPPTRVPVPPHATPYAPAENVELTGQRLATLSATGQYQYSPATRLYQFSLQLVRGVWLISELPQADQDSLLLMQSDFEHMYQARNLFFFARSPSPVNGKLVPDPVYAPVQSSESALTINLASGLVKGLFEDQKGWLGSETKTSFPRGTKLLGITITGQTAVVNLGGAATRTDALQWQQMAEQLQATLGSTAYSPALARVVQLEIDGQPKFTNPHNLIYDVPTGKLIFVTADGTVADGPGTGRLVLGPSELGPADITAVAVDPQYDTCPASKTSPCQVALAAKDGHGCEVYRAFLPAGGPSSGQSAPAYSSYRLSASGGECTSLSWDSNGNLWAAAGHHIWVLPAFGRKFRLAGLPPNLGARPAILALRMAPDAVRAALLVNTGGGVHLVLAAVRQEGNGLSLGIAVDLGTGLRDPRAMSWYSPYYLVVLDRAGIAEVPLTGGAGQQFGSAPAGADSVSTNGVTLAVGTAGGQIWVSNNLGSSWLKPQAGSLPSYLPSYPG